MSDTIAPGGAPAASGYLTGFGTKPYRSYVLTALTFIYILNFIDRGLLAVVAPALKPELGISDTAFGLLTGFGFAALYTTVGIPLAHYAEKHNRVLIMSVCVALWSAMTALCGLATEVTIGSVTIGAFWILLASRVGVGIGEAGCTPPANSLIADYYPPKKRSTALGYYAMGVTLGTLLANLIGGPVTDAFGWRWAFIVLGAPGIIVAVIFRMTVKEPPRGYSDPPSVVKRERASFGEALRELMSKTSFWTMTVAATIAAFGGYGIANFQSLFLNRSFGLTTGQAALWVNVPVSLSAAIGTFFVGWLAEKLTAKHPTAIAWLPAIGMLACVPFYLVAFTSNSLQVVLVCLVAGAFVKYGYLAAQYTIGQGVVSMRVRATSTAILLFVVNLIGYGLGPLFIGALSDFLFTLHVADMGMAGELARKSCEGAARAVLPLAQQEVCKIAHPQSLQQSMLVTASFYAVGAFFFLITCKWLKRDMVAV